ncbi:MAG: hypothetical protein H6557_21070 [Lewinellaceae bacterium]|nr:hypothetical protein [Phaeodactylibacter sp.]MCB9039111.1 hypothetical protein [Lewinellaceae bacterium]
MKPFTPPFSFVLLIAFFSLLSYPSGWAQQNTTDGTSSIPSFEDPYEDNIQRGIEALRKRNAEEAADWFEVVRKEAGRNHNNEQKKEAKDLRDKAEKNYSPYFSLLDNAERHAVQQEFKEALADYEKAKFEARKITDFPIETVREFDAQLWEDAQNMKDSAEQQRAEAYQKALSSGKAALAAGEPDKALALFEYAASQATYQDSHSGYINDWITDARYHIWLKKGENQFDLGNYELALQYFGQAKSINNDYNLESRIERANRNLYDRHLKQAEALYQQEDCALSAKAYQRAKLYGNSGEVSGRMMKRHDELLAKGKEDFNNKAYYCARIHFQNARHFEESTEVESYLKEVEKIINYTEFMEKGKNLMGEDKLDEAYNYFAKAANLRATEEVEQQLKKINDYQKRLREGQSAMESGQLAKAVLQFNEANALIYTPKVIELIAKANGLYTDVTVVVATDEILGKDLSQAALYLENLSRQDRHEQEYRGGKAHFFGLEPGRYQAYIYGVKEKDADNGSYSEIKLNYNDPFDLEGGKVDITLSANRVIVKRLDRP